MTAPSRTVMQAVMNEDDAAVRRLVAAGVPVDERNAKGETPLILAAKTDQFRTAEFLIQAGAQIGAASDFGWTVGYAAQTSRLVRGPEAEARDRVIAELKMRGYQMPAPHPADMQKIMKGGSWPVPQRPAS